MGEGQKVETIILRFRDGLVSDSTIKEHESIIEDKKYVWWGWWAKPQETVPAAVLSSMCVRIRDKQLVEIFLFDSGTLSLYKAKCEGIHYTNDKVKTGPPDEGGTTPAYYREKMYFVWFKLTSIEVCQPDILKEYSYVGVDEFYQNNSPHFQEFDNKVIFDVQELNGQQRTMWFIRKKKEDDKTHEVKSFVNPERAAGNVDGTFKVLPFDRILWLSDLHFSEDHHAFTKTKTENNSLFTRLNNIIGKEDINPAAVIISGDITFKALEEEYKQAEEFIRDLNSAYNLDGSSYAIIPGNHDLAFTSNPGNPDLEITSTYPEAKMNYCSFYDKVFSCMPNEELYSIRRYLTPELVPVEIICLNSCYLQQCEGAFQGLGYVGSNQLEKIKKDLELTNQARPVRILVLHHHLMPVMYKETAEFKKTYSLTLDAEAVVQFIYDYNIKLVLHGHNHKEFYAEIIRKRENKKKKFYIVGLGSTGAKAEELSDGRVNMFATIKIEKTQIEIDGLSISPVGESNTKLFTHVIPLHEEV